MLLPSDGLSCDDNDDDGIADDNDGNDGGGSDNADDAARTDMGAPDDNVAAADGVGADAAARVATSGSARGLSGGVVDGYLNLIL